MYPLRGAEKRGMSCSGTCGESESSKTRRCESLERTTIVLSCFDCGWNKTFRIVFLEEYTALPMCMTLNISHDIRVYHLGWMISDFNRLVEPNRGNDTIASSRVPTRANCVPL